MTSSKHLASLQKRLIPLYIAAFLHGFVLWYAIEKLFMRSIGFDDASIGGMIALYSTVMLLAETPSGILADRWSRKGVLIIASLALGLSAFVGGISTNQSTYMIAACLWGVFFAMYSGTYESIVYDTELEMLGNSKSYERYFGHIRVADSVALVIGSVAGGLIASTWSLRTPYFVTIPFSLAAIVALLFFKEPKLHKQINPGTMLDHIKDTFSVSLRNRKLLPIVLSSILVSTLMYVVFEFSQLWLIALALPVVFFGPINALVLSTIGTGGWLASSLKIRRKNRMLIGFMITFFACFGLAIFRNPTLIVACLFVVSVFLVAIGVVFSKLLHDGLHSRVRAGAASTVSTVGRIIIIPFSLIFGSVSSNSSVFKASWMLVGLTILLGGFLFWSYRELPSDH